MIKQDLVTEIEAYASARASGNPTLIQRTATILSEMLAKLPETIGENAEIEKAES